MPDDHRSTEPGGDRPRVSPERYEPPTVEDIDTTHMPVESAPVVADSPVAALE